MELVFRIWKASFSCLVENGILMLVKTEPLILKADDFYSIAAATSERLNQNALSLVNRTFQFRLREVVITGNWEGRERRF